MENCNCNHVDKCGWNINGASDLIEILKWAKGAGTCSECEKPSSEPVYMCLKKSCNKFGCSRNSKGHASKHFKLNESHCLSVNVRSLQVWCYECDEYVEGWDLLDYVKEKLDEVASDFLIENVRTNGFKSRNSGAVGLYNSGNSCFINAALQILLNCPTLLGFFHDNCKSFVVNRDRSGQNLNQPSVSEHFMALIDAVNNPECPAAVSPVKLIRTASHFNPSFHGYSQQDSMDFFRLLLDRLHEELKYPVPISAILDEGNNRKMRRKSGRLAKKNGAEEASIIYKSVISETFGGILRSEVQCHKCNKVSVKDDQFFDLSLPLQPSPQASASAASRSVIGNIFSSLGESLGIGSGKGMKLESAFVNFCLPEILDGKDCYFCEFCNQLVQSTKSLTLKSLPQVLCVQLKRFRHDSFFSSKLNNVVEYPVEGLDLRHFLHKEFIGSPLSSCSEYDLLGIVNHRGSFNGGHYVAYCKNFETGRWFEYDDSRVREVEESELLNIQAYLLFYIQKSDTERDKNRQEIIKIIEATAEASESNAFVSKQWYNRLLNSINPGPIDSFDVICSHGQLNPKLIANSNNISNFLQVLPDSEEFCERLRNVYGEVGGIGVLEGPEICSKCVEEAEALKRRRQREDEEIQALDTATVGEGDFWYLVDANWLHQWNAFKSGSQGPPGPISNTRLFKSNSGILRDNLSRGLHYRGVNERVWNYFHGIYGGGPIVKRQTINIYN